MTDELGRGGGGPSEVVDEERLIVKARGFTLGACLSHDVENVGLLLAAQMIDLIFKKHLPIDSHGTGVDMSVNVGSS